MEFEVKGYRMHYEIFGTRAVKRYFGCTAGPVPALTGNTFSMIRRLVFDSSDRTRGAMAHRRDLTAVTRLENLRATCSPCSTISELNESKRSG